MQKDRLTNLADGIFAIVMTLLVIEIRVPAISGPVFSAELWLSLVDMTPIFMSYLLSFVILFTYWRAHHYIVSGYAKNVDSVLLNINALFFFFVALVPFTSVLLGQYSTTQLAIVLFSLHVVVLGFVLYWMRNHILFAETVQNETISFGALWHSNMRVAVPIVFAILAIFLSFFSIMFSLVLLTLAVIFNLFTKSTSVVDWILKHIFKMRIDT